MPGVGEGGGGKKMIYIYIFPEGGGYYGALLRSIEARPN